MIARALYPGCKTLECVSALLASQTTRALNLSWLSAMFPKDTLSSLSRTITSYYFIQSVMAGDLPKAGFIIL